MGIHFFSVCVAHGGYHLNSSNEMAELRLCPLRGEVQMLGSFLWIRPPSRTANSEHCNIQQIFDELHQLTHSIPAK
jgi:hypothetical protein